MIQNKAKQEYLKDLFKYWYNPSVGIPNEVKIEKFFRIVFPIDENPEYKKLADLESLLKFAYFSIVRDNP
jgi:hypothetical protein